MQILVIDDDPELLDTVTHILELAGYEVLSASNGIDGLRLAHDHHPALIVSDVVMPEVSGYDVLDELQANSNTASIPVIFLTAKSEIHDIRHGMQLGADDYLTKPFIEEDLLRTIQRRLEKRHQWELQQRAAFTHELIQAQEQVSQRLANELDQTIRQNLLNFKVYLDSQAFNPVVYNVPLIKTIQQSIDTLITQVTTLSYTLYPVLIAQLGLLETLQWYFSIAQQRLNITIKFDTYNMEARLLEAAELVFYRVAQRVMEYITSASRDIHVVLWRDENTVCLSLMHLPLSDKNQRGYLLQLLEEYGRTINASIALQEDDEDGSTVSVTLHNAAFQQFKSSMPPPVLPPVLTTEKVFLVVSPDHAFLEYVAQLLKSTARIVACQTTDVDTLLSQLNIHAPQILILDLFVPLPVLTTIVPRAAIIVLSPYSDETSARQTLQHGAMSFIPKAAAHTELKAAVQTVMQGVRYVSAALVLGNHQSQPTKPLNLDVLLTRREREVMELILRDMTHGEIAANLVISPRTVEKHRANIMQKLALNTHTELILFALRHGLLSSI